MAGDEAPLVAHRIVPRKKLMQRRAMRVLPAILVLGLCSLVVYDVATAGELVSRPAQFLQQHWDLARSSAFTISDLRFPSKNSTAFRAEVLTNFTDFNETESHEAGCVAGITNTHAVTYPSGHRFYSLLRDIAPLSPPVFRGGHMALCNDTIRFTAKAEYCLPIQGRKDQPFCSAPDRLDLLSQQSIDTICHASVLHMIMSDVYNELENVGAQPLLVYSTLLGAVRDAAMLSFTEDTTISYMKRDLEFMMDVKARLWNKGYHMYFEDIWRVCVAPPHPLASVLYNPTMALSDAVPHTDLYQMERRKNEWALQETKNHRTLPDDVVRPFMQVHINGLKYNTVNDPVDFLMKEYGSFMSPKYEPGLRH